MKNKYLPMRFELSILLPLLAAIFIIAAWQLSNIENMAKTDLRKSLKTALDSSHDGIVRLYDSQKHVAQVLATEDEVRQEVESLLNTTRTNYALINSAAQSELRTLMRPVLDTLGYLGFFVIANDNINLASTRDVNVGDISLLANNGSFLDRVRAGETLISIPQHSDVPLSSSQERDNQDVATMFSATPVRDANNRVIAILAFRLDPYSGLSEIFDIGRFGESGETYAFDSSGRMLSASRFDEGLTEIGVLPSGSNSFLNLDIRDPGVDLTTGEKPSRPREEQPLTFMAQSATSGISSDNLEGYRDYRGVPVVGSWLWDEDLGFAIATEVNFDEAFTTFGNMRFAVITFSLVSAGALLLLAVIFSLNRRQIAKRDKRNNLILSSMAQGIFGVDRKGNATFVNREACLILGYDKEELLGKNMHEMIHHSYPDGSYFPRDECQMYNSFVSGTINSVDDEVLWHKDGFAIPVDYTSRPIVRDGYQITGAVVTFNDIRQRKKAELEQKRLQEELAQAQKLESLGQLSAGLAHEINTPCQYVSDNMSFIADSVAKLEPLLQEVPMLLGAVKGIGDPLEADDIERIEKLYEVADIEFLLEEAAASIGQSQSGMDHIKRVVSAMKAFSHPGDKRTQLDLNEAISNTLIVSSNEWKDIAELVTDFDKDLPLISCIPSAINQVVLNIVVNAAHAIASHPINKGLGEILVSTAVEDDQAIIKIVDNGSGMSEDVLVKIFDPFFTTKEVGKGTGQGLSIGRKIITDDHGGTISVDSVLGEGSCFTIFLPINRPAIDNKKEAEELAEGYVI